MAALEARAMTNRMTADDLYQLRALLERMKADPQTPGWVHSPVNQVLAVSSVMLDLPGVSDTAELCALYASQD